MQRDKLIKHILLSIQNEQTLAQSMDEFGQGHFPATRLHSYLPIERKDNNAFFAASVSYILQSCQVRLNDSYLSTLKSITDKTVQSFESYRHPERLSFNFWPRGSNKHFPNGLFMRHSSHFKLPDDIDTSSMILLAQKAKGDEVQDFHDLLPSHSNGASLTVKTSLSKWKQLPAYSSWLGVQMPIEIDLCVLSNALLLFQLTGISTNQHDEASWKLIQDAIQHQDWKSSTYVVAPSYPHRAVILYHLNRLYRHMPHGTIKNKLIEDTKAEFAETRNQWSKLLLSTSLSYHQIEHDKEVEIPAIDINWFTAGFLSVYPNRLAKLLAPSPWFQYQFRCRALSLSLILEQLSFRD